MNDYDRREADDMKAYELQQHMATAVLEMRIDSPTVEFAARKRYLSEMVYQAVPAIPVEDVFTYNDWDTNPQHLEVLIWTNYKDNYLPFFFGSMDGRNYGIANTKMKYDTATFTKGKKILLDKLNKIYRVIKYRNPVLIMPTAPVTVDIDWREYVSTKNTGTVSYYYRWSKQVHQIMGGVNIQSSFNPTFHHVNKLQPGQPAFSYTIEDDYHFVFFPVTKAPNKTESCDMPLDTTPMLNGLALATGELWPLNLKRMCFPMHMVETVRLPLFQFLKDNYYRKTNRSLGYYVLKEEQFYEFLETMGGVKSDGESTVIFKDEVLGLPIIKLTQTPDLIISETLAKFKAVEEWEDYEE